MEILNVDYVICPICNRKFKQLNSHLRTHNISKDEFKTRYPDCNLQCSNFAESTHKGQHGWHWPESSKKKQSEFIKSLWNNPKYLDSARDRNRELMKDRWNNPEYASKIISSWKKFRIKHTTFYNKEIILRSNYEKQFAEELDSIGIYYEYEPFRIKYDCEGIQKYYYPDFYIPSMNLILEVKPSNRFRDPISLSKCISCLRSGYKFMFITELEFNNLQKLLRSPSQKCVENLNSVNSGELLKL